MQSSPPTRAWDRQPQSPAGSEYSVDLAALDLDSHSGASSPLPTQQIDRVHSEDIDGPSDFTQNMDKWLRGGSLGKGSMGRASMGKGSMGKSSVRGGLQSLLEKHEEAQDNGEQKNGLSPVPDKGEGREGQGQEHSAGNHTPFNTPPKESLLGSQGCNRSQQHAISDWDPYQEGSTPQPPPHKQFLQPTVEDYHSELTPMRMQAANVPPSRTPKQPLPETIQESPNKSIASTPGRPSSDTMSPVRSPVHQAPSSRRFSTQTTEASFTQQLEELHSKCKHLEHLNSTLSQALNDELRARDQDAAAHEAMIADAAKRERSLTEMKDQAYQHKEEFRLENAEIKQRFQQREDAYGQRDQQMAEMKRQHAREMQTLREQMGRDKAEHSQEVRELQQDLEVAQRNCDEAEELARVHREEYQELQTIHETENDRTKLDLQQAADLRAQTSEIQRTLESLRAENNKAQTGRQEAEDEARDLRNELSLLKQAQDEEPDPDAHNPHYSKTQTEELLNDRAALQKRLQDQGSSHAAELKRLKAQHDSVTSTSPEDLADLRTELEAKQSELNAATIDRDSAQDDLETAQADLASAKEQLANLEAASAAFDHKVSEAVGRREKYWRGRMNESEKERGVMAKALLRQWGREEVGAEEPQRYAYKYAQRSPKASAGV